MAGTGVGATLTFGGSVSFSGRIRSIGGLREFVEILDDTALDADGFKESCPDDLLDSDPVEITFDFDSGTPRAPVGTLGTMTITFSGTSPATYTGSGFFSEFTSAEMVPGQRNVATAMWKYDGKTGPTYATA